MLEIEKFIPKENFFIGLLFNEGYWLVKLLRKQQLTVYRSYDFYETADISLGGTSGWACPADPQGRFYLEPQDEETIYQFFTGISPSMAKMYLQYTQREDRMNLITPRPVPGPIGFWQGEYTRYLDPSPATELWTVHDIYPYFNVELPNFGGSAYASDRQPIFASFYITPFTYQVLKANKGTGGAPDGVDRAKALSLLRGEKRCTIITMGDGDRPIKAPAWLNEDYGKFMIQPEEV